METPRNVGKLDATRQDEVKQMAGVIAERLLTENREVLESPMVEMEEVAVEVSRRVGEEVFRTLLARQAETQDHPTIPCEQCGEPCGKRQPRRRELTTRAGPVCWYEPVYHCRQCRRSFSPSVRKTEH